MREVIKSDQRSSSAIRRNQVQSELIRRNQSSSDAISTGRLLHAAVEAAFVALGLDDAIGHMPRARQEETWPQKRGALAELGRRSSQALSGAIRGHQRSSVFITASEGRRAARLRHREQPEAHVPAPVPKDLRGHGGGGAVVSTCMLLSVVLSTCMLMGSTVEGSAS